MSSKQVSEFFFTQASPWLVQVQDLRIRAKAGDEDGLLEPSESSLPQAPDVLRAL
ncbi:TPA: hypothetical protein N0F65_005142 [Lagenidium giganteum]|uniref:Uncharacterized protein n=1 Tax=Lagenidium giganteum TaxID=4803 RepID=A0AAV2YXG7_9STRA|nr:TPA: hypothetical protein N0F65_005142 [Lagenidium giganteum]